MHPVVVSDLDGTLLNEHHQLANRTKEVIRRLSGQGIRFVFATGRHHLDVECFRSQIGVDMYTITSNGARVLNPKGEIIIRHDIPEINVQTLIKLGRKYNDTVSLNLYTETHWYIEKTNELLLEFNGSSGITVGKNEYILR